MLLHIVKGATSFAQIKIVSGHLHPTFRAACEALGLLGDDQEWLNALNDAAQWAMPYQLRQLFVTILLLCEVTNHRKLLDEYASKMSEDAAHRLNRNPGQMSNLLADVYISSFLLNELDKLLKDARYCLSHFNLPLPDDIGSISAENRLMLDELSYDISDMTESLDENITRLNSNKKNVFDAIYNSAMNDDGRTFFVYGYGGTGKTFLWTTLLNSVRRQGKIALAVASSGIASLLLPGGRTSHSRFKIPLDISQNSMCSIKKNTNLAEFIQKTSLIIWNEAPVNHRYCFEALDRTLRDILSKRRQNADSKQFGGMTVVLDGDFRQTLLVLQNATKRQILRSCIVNSYLWKQCTLLQLSENMRLKSENLSTPDREELSNFAEWLLGVGNGTEPFVSVPNEPTNCFIEIPQSLLLSPDSRNLDGLISFVYDLGCEPANITSYLCDRAILAPTNEVVSKINTRMIDLLATTEMTYHSSDSIDDSSADHCTLESLYPTEFLNTISLPGLSEH